MNGEQPVPQDTRKLFRELGTCSSTLFFILDRQFDHPMPTEERAADPLAGGLWRRGCQCGMLWGSALAVGEESFRRYGAGGDAIRTAIQATQRLTTSFSRRAGSVDCRDIVGLDLSRTLQLIGFTFKYVLFGNPTCPELAARWAPEAIESASEALSGEPGSPARPATSCASEVARRMGASDEQRVAVAGLAGGLGLSGDACGALAAAIWIRTLGWCAEHPRRSAYFAPHAKRLLKVFRAATGSELLCRRIAGRSFDSIDEHSDFVSGGGCAELIERLGRA